MLLAQGTEISVFNSIFFSFKGRQDSKLNYLVGNTDSGGNGKLSESYTHVQAKSGSSYLVRGIWDLLIVKTSLSIYLSDTIHKAWFKSLFLKEMVSAVIVLWHCHPRDHLGTNYGCKLKATEGDLV